ncbi:hypothetical protein B0I72DRAFT_94803 [Yarrowia lipolytica]|uniref:YALI0E12639p n=2 Tax=Yarrowia lipolytica TaxID=4952 RepID=Q6C640_YARLI|nr:YALI0E12639p [Yarrowia lipolytica CLIB122]RDW27501.1 hypothetical protein B0I71DRAFT_157690 [Yarrowia lipolytica]RDW33861.1 hypothetical protein B0I72DRAFT_94803 [Yarrowia lipolytica]RDW38103.1 hypothetical protein B0I73DRAFT_121790 [Yarrowia lipolytica]RDW49215.1 hypothetical protein B0I74DRAFT_165267 [Yarrowia lipolytica]RDW55802.1 hypothetical protein B0I75DRAFT_161487 [Yarrowia lipolytica]|eukprot:XP_503872.1 YALI0E12639p [Yarrowia lipolytica CLIB122]
MSDNLNVTALSRAYTQTQCVSLLSQVADSVTCIVCQELMCLPCVLECGHSYCYDCISTWFTKVNTCPSCRKECHKKPHISHAAAGISKAIIAAIIETDPSRKAEYDELMQRQTEEYKRDLSIHNSMLPGLFSDSEDGSDFQFDASLASALDIETHEGGFDSDELSDSGSEMMYGVPGNIHWLDRQGQRHYLDWGTTINHIIMQSYYRHRVEVSIRAVSDTTEHTEQYHDAPDSHYAPRTPTEEFHDARPSRRHIPERVMIERPPRRNSPPSEHVPPVETPDISLGVRHAIKWITVEPTKLTIGVANGDEKTFTRVVDAHINGSRGSDSEGYFSS